MDILKLVEIVGLACSIGVVISFGGYAYVTTRALRTKDREIARLKMQLKNTQKKEKIEVIHTVKDGRVPEYGGF